MSPLRPSLLSLRPRRPQPTSLRSVSCPSCGRGFDISQKALTVRCPACTSPLRLDDLVMRHDHHGTVATMGQVQILSHTALSGMIVCGKLASHGRFDGQAMVHGSVELSRESFTAGEIHARSLVVVLGANLRVKASISPKPLTGGGAMVPSPVASHRPLQLAPPRRAR